MAKDVSNAAAIPGSIPRKCLSSICLSVRGTDAFLIVHSLALSLPTRTFPFDGRRGRILLWFNSPFPVPRGFDETSLQLSFVRAVPLV